jgi:hypothetical protein
MVAFPGKGVRAATGCVRAAGTAALRAQGQRGATLGWKHTFPLRYTALMRKTSPFSACVLCILLAAGLCGCRRNLMRISTSPPGAQVFVEGRAVRYEDADRKTAKRIDRKKEREKSLSEKDLDFERDRRKLQASPTEYEFESVACGYTVYCQMNGYHPVSKVIYLKPRWYEYPPIDLFVDLLPYTVTDTREVEIALVPKGNPAPSQTDGR